MKIKHALLLAGALSIAISSCKKDDTESPDDSGYCSLNTSVCTSTITVTNGDTLTLDLEYSSGNELLTIKNRKTGITMNEVTHTDALTEVVRIWNEDGSYQATGIYHFSENGLMTSEEYYNADSTIKFEYAYRYNSAKELYERVQWLRTKSSGYKYGPEVDSIRYEWSSGNMINMYTYYRDTLSFITEYEYADNSNGRQFSLATPNRIGKEIMYKNVAREGSLLSKDFCIKSRDFDTRKNRYVDSTIIEPVFDKTNKLIQFNRNFYKEGTSGWETTVSYGELNYRCF